MFVVDSGASMHILSKKDLSSDEIDTLRRSRTVVTANGEVKTNEAIWSSQCTNSKKLQQRCRLESFAQKTDVHMSGKKR